MPALLAGSSRRVPPHPPAGCVLLAPSLREACWQPSPPAAHAAATRQLSVPIGSPAAAASLGLAAPPATCASAGSGLVAEQPPMLLRAAPALTARRHWLKGQLRRLLVLAQLSVHPAWPLLHLACGSCQQVSVLLSQPGNAHAAKPHRG